MVPFAFARKLASAKPTSKPPTHAARMLALAYHVEDLVARGVINNFAEAAARLGVSRARINNRQ